jgi:hypothetical protein
MNFIRKLFSSNKSNLAKEAYILTRDLSNIGDDVYVAELVRFPGHENIAGWQGIRYNAVPEPIYFEANFSALETTDFPFNNVAWPIMSCRMVKCLTATGHFDHKKIEIAMIDDTVPTTKRVDQKGKYLPQYLNKSYTCIQLLSYCDVFDWKNSKFDIDEDDPGYVDFIEKLVLKAPGNGFPPFFRMKAATSYKFVSGAAKRAMEKYDLKGVSFEPVLTSDDSK